MTLRDELSGHGGIPEPAMEKEDTIEVRGFGIMSGGEKEVRRERTLGGFVIDIRVRVLEELAVASLSDGRCFCQLRQRRHIKKKVVAEPGVCR